MRDMDAPPVPGCPVGAGLAHAMEPPSAGNATQATRFSGLRALSFFKGFSDVALRELLRFARFTTFQRGEVLMREESLGDSFMVLLEGRVAVSRNDWKLVSLEAGVTLGEMTFLQPEHPLRTATAVAETDVSVLEVPNAALHLASDRLQKHFDKVFIRQLVQRLSDTTARMGSLGTDTEKARGYVESLLPPPMSTGPVRTEWSYVPSAQLGGDAFGYHWLGEHTLAVYLMDVSGHGVRPAMHSVSVMNVMRQRALPGCDFHEPSQVLAHLNDMFQMEAHDGMYFSIWYGVYDVRDRSLRYASGGHHPSCLVSSDRARMDPLRTRNLVIGAMPGLPFASATVQVEPDSSLYVFSDGVFEVLGPGGKQFGLPDFLPLLQQPRAGDGQEAARIEGAVRAMSRPGPLDDDFTLLVVTFPS